MTLSRPGAEPEIDLGTSPPQNAADGVVFAVAVPETMGASSGPTAVVTGLPQPPRVATVTGPVAPPSHNQQLAVSTTVAQQQPMPVHRNDSSNNCCCICAIISGVIGCCCVLPAIIVVIVWVVAFSQVVDEINDDEFWNQFNDDIYNSLNEGN